MIFYKVKMGAVAPLASLWLLCLTGCASAPKPAPLILPQNLFQCLKEPIPPILTEGVRDSQIALYVKDLAYAGRDCRDQLKDVGETLNLQPGIDVTDIITPKAKAKKRWWLF